MVLLLQVNKQHHSELSREDFFFVGYCEALETHLMTVFVSWADDKQI
ncbi:hypothetical protein VJJ50_08340 [Capnocytophaga ochracea]|nr:MULTISPECIES: hypothetical protein [Capnocytophaga]MEB3016882.1 hypothetical protein [Capnocytophaga ochracea]MEB3036795.1 hypothetical protein [Capnocytophaga ochracea]